MIVDAYAPECPIRNVLARLSDKWSLLLLYWLNKEGVMRFGDLRRAVPDVSQKMLTVTLRTLEVDGFVTRKVYAQIPPKVEYELTDRARSFIPHVEAMIAWAIENMADIVADRQKALTMKD